MLFFLILSSLSSLLSQRSHLEMWGKGVGGFPSHQSAPSGPKESEQPLATCWAVLWVPHTSHVHLSPRAEVLWDNRTLEREPATQPLSTLILVISTLVLLPCPQATCSLKWPSLAHHFSPGTVPLFFPVLQFSLFQHRENHIYSENHSVEL